MEKGDGVSYAEFSYPLMQAWDWWYMYSTRGIQVQIGGSDQFGNIVAGVDAVKYILKSHHDPLIRQEEEIFLNKPMGFTVPLLTTASGEKFGKSEGNAVWLSKEMTPTFDQYQVCTSSLASSRTASLIVSKFFLRTADADVSRYLRLFTFIPITDIDQIMQEHSVAPQKRIAQRRLAREVIEFLHGDVEAENVESEHRKLFQSSPAHETLPARTGLPQDVGINHTAQANTYNAPNVNVILPRSLVFNQPFARILHSAGLVSSRSEGHRLGNAQGAYVGHRSGGGPMSDDLSFTPVKLWKPEETQKYVIDDDVMILRAGKWKVKVIKIISDEDFEKAGLDAPGWKA